MGLVRARAARRAARQSGVDGLWAGVFYRVLRHQLPVPARPDARWPALDPIVRLDDLAGALVSGDDCAVGGDRGRGAAAAQAPPGPQNLGERDRDEPGKLRAAGGAGGAGRAGLTLVMRLTPVVFPAFGRVVLFVYYAPVSAQSAETGAQKIIEYLAAAGRIAAPRSTVWVMSPET